MTQIAIHIPDDLSQFVERSVKNGAWGNAEEFVVSMLYHEKEKSDAAEFDESKLHPEDKAKLAALRQDIQLGIDSLDRGEGIRNFDWDAFLERKNREHVADAAD
jgi:Arc/MetJ-type ribon-helix-helix transcriptional regulator